MTTTKTDTPALQYAEATAALDAADSILIVTHIFPDGDAIGSLLGLGLALKARYPGKRIDLAVDGGVPDYLSYVPESAAVLSTLNAGSWQVLVSVDASDEVRTGEVGKYGRANSQQVINLDHHATNTGFGQLHLINPGAVSATEVVFDWLTVMQQPLSRSVAVALLTGLMTDTLGFRTSNVTPRTLEIAQALMLAGASITEIAQRALSSMSYTTLALWREVFSSIQLQDGIIYAVVTLDDLARAGADNSTEIGLSSFMVNVNEAMVSAVFKELVNNQVELSFRSKPGFDVGRVAFALGGGGHKQASGATIDATLDEALARVLPLLQAAVQSGQLLIS